MCILVPIFFLSFLAGKIKNFKQKLLTTTIEIKKKKTAHAYFGTRIFLRFLAGKIKIFKQKLLLAKF